MAAASEVARAFAERSTLARYETTLAFCPEAWPDRALRTGARWLLGARAEGALGRRVLDHLPRERVHRSPQWDLLRLLAARFGDQVRADRLWEHMVLDFDARVARRLTAAHGVVYGFEHACRDTLARAASLGVLGVLDMAAPHFTFTERVLVDQVAAFPELRNAHWDATYPLAAVRHRRKQDEFELAGLIIANSRFTAGTLQGTGVAADKVKVVPLGAPEIDPSWRERSPSRLVQVLFAGNISVHKGAHLLLEAWRSLAVGSSAELLLAGTWLLPARMRAELPNGVRLLGRLSSGALREQYRSATVLVLPSLLDGFGMVVTEALAHGLPVITTSHTGAADLIVDDENGWVIGAGDSAALAARLHHCLTNASQLREMREAAECAAARRPWSVYRSELVDTVYGSLPAHYIGGR